MKTGAKVAAVLAAAALAAKAGHEYSKSRRPYKPTPPKGGPSGPSYKVPKPVTVSKPGGEHMKSPSVPRQNKPIPVKPVMKPTVVRRKM